MKRQLTILAFTALTVMAFISAALMAPSPALAGGATQIAGIGFFAHTGNLCHWRGAGRNRKLTELLNFLCVDERREIYVDKNSVFTTLGAFKQRRRPLFLNDYAVSYEFRVSGVAS